MDGMRKSMDRLRRSLRQSFRRSKKSPSTSTSLPDTTQPPQWQNDETAVRAGNCSFQVKYLGCVEVFESRGMQICEEALKQLRHSTRKSQRAVLHISGDGLRVVDATSSQLIVDQTIEKVSFCAPDRNHDRGFSYICRDGATRRWLCHGFIAVRESGERLSHAVGCSFQICLEKKQKRDREIASSSQPLPQSMSQTEIASVHTPSPFVTQTPPRSASSLPLTRSASTTPASTFVRRSCTRTSTIIERMKDPQEGRQASPPPLPTGNVVNPHMRDRPHVTPQMLERQQSLRVFSTLNSATPFKRNTSLQSRDVPTTLASQRKQMSFDVPSVAPKIREINNNVPTWEDGTPILDEPDSILAEEPEEMTEEVSRLCQQMSFDLSSMSASHLNSSTRHEYAKLPNGGSSGVNGAGDQTVNAAACPLPKSTTVHFPVVRQHETAQEARMRFAERSPFTRTVHPPVNGVMTNGYTNHSASTVQNGHSTATQNGGVQKQPVNGIDWSDPFNADWVQVQRNDGASTNPFLT
ncbi:hypothetical protein RvY_06019 [Ramazzottius varieornatus]|uniref:PID domain-containing protein n=1 Tax=Ramazzottius varieornatus TaxID=947166 RepID=A0A1D1V3K0_RAMVA|nr:hypothetical protein RvY_06019 [Ramazzottius varieornatus]